MAYGSYRRSGSRRGYSSRGGRSRSYARARGTNWNSVASTAAAAFRTAKYVASLVNVEFKESNQSNSTFSIGNTSIPNPILLTDLAEGDDKFNRNGRTVLLKSQYLTGTLSLATTSTTANLRDAAFRIIVINWTNSNGVSPTLDKVLLDPSSIESPLNKDYAGALFRILHDKRYTLNANGNTIQWVKAYNRLQHHATWNDPSGGPTTAISGHIFMYIMGNSKTAAANATLGTFDFTNRVQFVDN